MDKFDGWTHLSQFCVWRRVQNWTDTLLAKLDIPCDSPSVHISWAFRNMLPMRGTHLLCMKFTHIPYMYLFVSLLHSYLINESYQPCAWKFACWDPGELREYDPKLILHKYNMSNQGFLTHKNKCHDHEKLGALENHTNIILRPMNFLSKWRTSSNVTLDPPLKKKKGLLKVLETSHD